MYVNPYLTEDFMNLNIIKYFFLNEESEQVPAVRLDLVYCLVLS